MDFITVKTAEYGRIAHVRLSAIVAMSRLAKSGKDTKLHMINGSEIVCIGLDFSALRAYLERYGNEFIDAHEITI